MLRELSPVVRRQAQRICRERPAITEDAFQVGRLKLWALLEEGVTEPAYLLASSRNAILNLLKHESHEPRPFAHDGEVDPWDFVRAEDTSIGDARCRVVIDQQDGNLRSALLKRCFSDEPLTSAERVALHRFRKRADREDWVR